MKHTIEKFFTLLEYFIILVLIIFIVYFCYQKFICKNTSFGLIKYNFFTILSGSMEPTIKTKDLIVTHPKSTYDVGDIVAFRENNTIIVHRIIKTDYKDGKKLFTTKGDNNNAPDMGKISTDNIVGSYIFTIPLLGSLVIFFSSNPIFIIIIIIMIILIYFIVKLIKKSRCKS